MALEVSFILRPKMAPPITDPHNMTAFSFHEGCQKFHATFFFYIPLNIELIEWGPGDGECWCHVKGFYSSSRSWLYQCFNRHFPHGFLRQIYGIENWHIYSEKKNSTLEPMFLKKQYPRKEDIKKAYRKWKPVVDVFSQYSQSSPIHLHNLQYKDIHSFLCNQDMDHLIHCYDQIGKNMVDPNPCWKELGISDLFGIDLEHFNEFEEEILESRGLSIGDELEENPKLAKFDISDNAKRIWENKREIFKGIAGGVTKEVLIKMLEWMYKLFLTPITIKGLLKYSILTVKIVYRIIRLFTQSGVSPGSIIALVILLPSWVGYTAKIIYDLMFFVGFRTSYKLMKLVGGKDITEIFKHALKRIWAKKIFSEEIMEKFFFALGILRILEDLLNGGKFTNITKEQIREQVERHGSLKGVVKLAKRLKL